MKINWFENAFVLKDDSVIEKLYIKNFLKVASYLKHFQFYLSILHILCSVFHAESKNTKTNICHCSLWGLKEQFKYDKGGNDMPYIWEVSTKNNNYDQKKRQKGNFSMKHYTRTYWYLAGGFRYFLLNISRTPIWNVKSKFDQK